MTRMRRTRPLTPQALRAARTRQRGGPLFLSRKKPARAGSSGRVRLREAQTATQPSKPVLIT